MYRCPPSPAPPYAHTAPHPPVKPHAHAHTRTRAHAHGPPHHSRHSSGDVRRIGMSARRRLMPLQRRNGLLTGSPHTCSLASSSPARQHGPRSCGSHALPTSGSASAPPCRSSPPATVRYPGYCTPPPATPNAARRFSIPTSSLSRLSLTRAWGSLIFTG
jgi:hypothetical protein